MSTDPPGLLTSIAQDEVVLVEPRWVGCTRLIPYHLCGGRYSCPQGCRQSCWASACSIELTGSQSFKLCEYTGRPWDVCWERTFFICAATGFPCNDCTGTPLWTSIAIGWSCWNSC